VFEEILKSIILKVGRMVEGGGEGGGGRGRCTTR
jgi:hypothetical protein